MDEKSSDEKWLSVIQALFVRGSRKADRGAIEMLKALAEDAIFTITVFLETLAALSIFQQAGAIQFREELAPVLFFYREHALPVIAFAANLLPVNTPPWFADAYVIAAVLFFLFFIEQARRGMAPYDDLPPNFTGRDLKPVEIAIDAILPAAACAIGAFVSAVTLLPFLTLPVALWLGARKLLGKPSWFGVRRSYYVNAVVVAAATAAVYALPG
jgi:hypothetical protein